MMAGIKGRDTRPEMLLRSGLHAMGFRYRVVDRGLPGRPDMVFPRYRAVVFAHGCFWHGHDCHLFRLPASRTEFWQAKIDGNRARDVASEARLAEAGWRVLTVWECALRGRTRRPLDEVLAYCAEWLRGEDPRGIIRGAA